MFASCFGMLVLALVIGLYYTCLFPTLPTASLEAAEMYDYANDYHDLRLKKDLSHPEEEGNLSDYYDTSSDNHLYRPKRNETTPSSSSYNASTTSDQVTTKNTTETDSTPSFRSTMNVDNAKVHPAPNTATTAGYTEEVDFGISIRFLDSVFKFATNADMKDPLGLCRSNININMPQFNISFFPPEDGKDILTCLNDVLFNTTMGNLCVHLDGELEAYLRWLVLMGEPKKKPPKRPTDDDILFPSPCEDDHVKLNPKFTTNSPNSTIC